MTNGIATYMNSVFSLLDAIARTQTHVLQQAADLVAQTIKDGHLVYLFGTGHSHMLCEEGHYRAGGVAAVCPILSTNLMLHESAITSTQLERLGGLGSAILKRYQLTPDDVMIIFSNSGVNAVPVEVAQAAKNIGMKTIAIVAIEYASQANVGSVGIKLHDIADIVIDNHGPPGDATVDVGSDGLRTGPISTIVGAFILNSILTEAVMQLAAAGVDPLPVYISANMPGANEHNAILAEHYRTRNPHL